jgi:hypothetical protein
MVGGSSLDNGGTGRYWHTARARQARRRGVRTQKPVVEPPREVAPARNLVDRGRDGSASVFMWSEEAGSRVDGGRPARGVMAKVCGLAVARAAGEKLDADPVNRTVVNVGTVVGSLPSPAGSLAGQRPGCRLLMARRRGRSPRSSRGSYAPAREGGKLATERRRGASSQLRHGISGGRR